MDCYIVIKKNEGGSTLSILIYTDLQDILSKKLVSGQWNDTILSKRNKKFLKDTERDRDREGEQEGGKEWGREEREPVSV